MIVDFDRGQVDRVVPSMLLLLQVRGVDVLDHHHLSAII